MPQVDCMIAATHLPLGKQVVVTGPRATRLCRVTDVPRPRDKANLVRRNIIIELDWPTARVMCGLSKPSARPPRDCPVTIHYWEDESGSG